MSLISENIRFLRKKKGLTQLEFANSLAIKRSLVGAYEEGRAIPPPENLNKLAKMFGYSMDQLMNENFRLIEHNSSQKIEANSNSLETAKPDLFSQFENLVSTPPINVSESYGVKESVIQKQQDIFEVNASFKIVKRQQYLAYLNRYRDPSFLVQLPEMSFPGLEKGNYRAFESGEDFLIEDSILIGKLINDLRDIKNGKTYILLTRSQGILYRRVYNQIDIKATLLLSSDFQEISSLEIFSNEVLECWELVYYMSSQIPKPKASLQKLEYLVDELKAEISKMN